MKPLACILLSTIKKKKVQISLFHSKDLESVWGGFQKSVVLSLLGNFSDQILWLIYLSVIRDFVEDINRMWEMLSLLDLICYSLEEFTLTIYPLLQINKRVKKQGPKILI